MTVLTAITERDLFLNTVRFQTGSPAPLMTMGPRESTIAAWHAQGLVHGTPWFRAMLEHLRLDYPLPRRKNPGLGVNLHMNPIFEEKILEHVGGHYIVQDWMGNITEISDQYDLTYLRSARDFVTRKWHRFPVAAPADFTAMKTRYRVDDLTRFPDDFADRCRQFADRDYLLTLNIPGPFWQLREWCGFEPLCMLFADQPDFVAEMIGFWRDFVAAMLHRLLDRVVIDRVHISEDMAYKGASMISPAMTRRHLLPVWQRWGTIVHQAGVPVYDMDSDGKIDQLIPLWIEAGFDLCDPLEVAAGCDVARYREQFGRRIAFSGGVDKRLIARGGAELDREMDRLAPVVRQGGFIPGCDHGIPPDVTWPKFLQFAERWAEITGWRR